MAKLFVIATPIGNLDDATLRSVETLKTVDIIACENKSRHIKLLNHYNIKKRIIEYSPSNEQNSAKGIVSLLRQGLNVALVSDAGTPGISDPGKFAVVSAREAGFEVVPIPGVSALTTLLSVTGQSPKRIVFLGFLQKSAAKQKKELELFKNMECMIVIFLNGTNLNNFLKTVIVTLGNVEIIIGREMTKINEEFIIGKTVDVLEKSPELKGEFVIGVNILPARKLRKNKYRTINFEIE